MEHEARRPLATAESFLEEHPDLQVVEVIIADTTGILRGKWLPPGALKKIFTDGIRMPRSTFALDVWGQDVAASGLVFETGDADGLCLPVAGSLKMVPWLSRPTAQVLLTMQDTDDTPFYGDPRQVLAGVLRRFTDDGLTPVVAMELEFYLLDRTADAQGRPQPPVSPISGQRHATTQVYGISQLEEFEELLADIERACELQGLPTDTTVSESAPGQYEISIMHVPDAMAAADNALLIKRAIKGVASSHQTKATFMAKPYGEQSGNGLHAHFSLLDAGGRNVFDDGSAQGSPLLRHAVGGMAATMAEAMAIFAPNSNSYRRFQPGSFAPLSPAWGYDNRSTALRIPRADGPSMRIEHRVAGADANPYLALAAMLAGAHHGISNEIEPPPPTVGDAYAQHPPSLPNSWTDALDRFLRSETFGDYFGSDYCKLYDACKRQELNELKKRVTNVEYESYLEVV